GGGGVLNCLAVPPSADRENEAAARKLVEARHRLGGDDGVTLRNKRDAGAELERARRRRGERQRDEGIVGMRIALGQLAAAGIGRAPAHRDMRVLAHEQRVEAALLERARQFVDRDAVVGRKMKGANQHSPPIQRVMPAAPRAVDVIAGGCGTYSMRPSSMSCRTRDETRAGSDEIDASA